MEISRFSSFGEFVSDKKAGGLGTPTPKTIILTGLNPSFYRRKFWFNFVGRIGTENGIDGDMVFRLNGSPVWSYRFLWRGNGPIVTESLSYFSQEGDGNSSQVFGETLKTTQTGSGGITQVHPISFIAAIDEVEFVKRRQIGADGDQRWDYMIAILSERMLGAKSPNNLACHFA